MKAFSLVSPIATLTVATLASACAAYAADAPPPDPTLGGPLVELRKAPVFTSPTIPLAKTWGVAIPVGTPFEVEKVYGRWIYGHPSPLPHQPAKDHSPPGWVFSRTLLMPGDSDTLPPAVVQQSRTLLYHARLAWTKLKLGQEPLLSPLDALESVTLSKRTLAAFSLPEHPPPSTGGALSLEPLAFAAGADDQPTSEEAAAAPMGLSGTDLRFLDQEIQVVRNRNRRNAKSLAAKHAHVPPPPPLDDKTRLGILGRYMLDRYLELPPLSLEEIDGYVYMRATAMRALQGCPVKVRDYWKNRRWGFFRVYRMKSRPEIKDPWFEIALPGGYFGVSGKAIDLATDEAELAFLLVRQMVRELHVKRANVQVSKAGWPASLSAKAETLWDQVLKAQSTKDSEGFDVADEIAVDSQAVECLSKAGYRPMSAVAYLKKLAAYREAPWAAWYAQHVIGLDYRIGRLTELTQQALAEQKYPEGKDGQEKRFASAVKQWNILP